MRKIVAGLSILVILTVLFVPWIPPITSWKWSLFEDSLIMLIIIYLFLLFVDRAIRDFKINWRQDGISLIELLIVLSIIIILILLLFQKRLG